MAARPFLLFRRFSRRGNMIHGKFFNLALVHQLLEHLVDFIQQFGVALFGQPCCKTSVNSSSSRIFNSGFAFTSSWAGSSSMTKQSAFPDFTSSAAARYSSAGSRCSPDNPLCRKPPYRLRCPAERKLFCRSRHPVR